MFANGSSWAQFAIAITVLVAIPLSATAEVEPPIAPDEEPSTETFDRFGIEEPEGSARASLVTGQTLHGGILGLQTCALMDCESPRPLIGLPVLGAGAGLGLSLFATHERGITSGHASAINSGTVWGAWISGLSAAIGDVDDDGTAIAVVMAGQLAGTGAGYGAGRTLGATSGDVLFVNSSALWALGYYFVIMEGLADRMVTGRSGRAEMLGVSLAGGLAGGTLASQFPMSRGRLAIINASGLLGGLAGAGVPIMIAGEDVRGRAVWASMLGGSSVGLGLGSYFTRQWDDDVFGDSSTSLSVAPTPDVDGVQATISGRW